MYYHLLILILGELKRKNLVSEFNLSEINFKQVLKYIFSFFFLLHQSDFFIQKHMDNI